MVDIIVPSPGESIAEVEIGSWMFEDGAWVEQDQEIGSIESEKATLEITAPAAGFLSISAQPGDVVRVGESIGQIKPGERPAGTAEPKTAPPAKKEPASASSEKEQTEHKPAEDTAKASSPQDADAYSRVKMTPVARKLMEEKGLTIQDVMDGLVRITKQDVESLAKDHQSLPPAPAAKKPSERQADRTRMSLLRRKLSERLVAVKNETAMLTTFNEIDMSAVMSLRKQVQAEFQQKHGIKLGFMSFFSLAAARSLQVFPNINAQIDGEEMISFSYADIGIAVQTPKGLMVPVIRDVQNKSLADIEHDIAAIAEKARNNKIALEDLEGGTFSITNGGVFGSLLSTPILNPPQSAILGMHNIVERPVAIDQQVVIRPMMYVALSYDHRIVDGKDSVGFLKNIKDLIENPYKLLDPSGQPEKGLFDL